jgi:hypothetical protein
MKSTGRALLMSAAVAAFLAAGVASSISATPAFAGDEDKKPKKSVDPADVYFGDAAKWEKPAEVDPDKVYAKIEEYKEIVDQGLKPGDAKYEILMCKASKRFTKAVKKAAKDGTYDLAAKKGSVKGVDSVPEITDDVIADL